MVRPCQGVLLQLQATEVVVVGAHASCGTGGVLLQLQATEVVVVGAHATDFKEKSAGLFSGCEAGSLPTLIETVRVALSPARRSFEETSHDPRLDSL
jgi:hypothetical protein